jgi:hypothetical protein
MNQDSTYELMGIGEQANSGASLGADLPVNLIDQFELEAGKETFGNGVVPAITAPTHAAAQTVLGEQLLVIAARVLSSDPNG